MSKRDEPALKSRTKHYEKILHAKAEDVRRSVTAQRSRQTVARLDVPSDEGDLSHQSHEEWLFLNRNNLEIKLLREVQQALRRVGDGGGRDRNGHADGKVNGAVAKDVNDTKKGVEMQVKGGEVAERGANGETEKQRKKKEKGKDEEEEGSSGEEENENAR